MDELLLSFKEESETLIEELENILDELEDDFSKKTKLNDFAQIIDRIMGSAQSLTSFGFEQAEILRLGDFAELCKQIGYRGANVEEEEFYSVTIAFLFDAVESMRKLLTSVGQDNQVQSISKLLVSTFLSRLKWILEQFESRAIAKTDYTAGKLKSQDEINKLIDSLEGKEK